MSLSKKIVDTILKHNRILINIVIPGFFIGFFLIISFTSISRTSDTTDEKFHLTRGIMLLKTGDLRINQHHPYLFNLIDAIPAVFNSQLKTPDTNSDLWKEARKDELSTQLVELNGGREKFTQLILYGPRSFAIIFTSILIAITYFLILRLFGPIVSVVILAFLTTDPNMIAHTRLITTDAPSVLMIFLTSLLFFKILKENTNGKYQLSTLIFISIVSLLTLLTKYTAIFVIAPLVILLGVNTFRNLNKSSKSKLNRFYLSIKPVLIISVIIFISMIAAYKFQFAKLIDMAYGNEQKIASNMNSFESISLIGPSLEYVYKNVPLPFPQYVNGFYENVFKHNYFGHSSFFNGEFSNRGWILYFPEAFLIKEPFGTLFFIGFSAFIGLFMLFKKKMRFELIYLALILPPLIIASLSLISSINLGIRHILPIFPFLFLYGGIVVDKITTRKNFLAILSSLVILIVINIFAVLSVFPHYIPYFNSFADGSSNGYKYIRDSNFDWEQNFLHVQDYIYDNPDKLITTEPENAIQFKYDQLVLSKEVLYGNPEKREESVRLIKESLKSGDSEIVGEVGFTHVVIDLSDDFR